MSLKVSRRSRLASPDTLALKMPSTFPLRLLGNLNGVPTSVPGYCLRAYLIKMQAQQEISSNVHTGKIVCTLLMLATKLYVCMFCSMLDEALNL